MKAFKRNSLSSFLLPEKGCKFGRSCSFYSRASYTCADIGGNYCGKYRMLLQKAQKNAVSNRLAEEALIIA